MPPTVILTTEQQQAADSIARWVRTTIEECQAGTPPVKTWFTFGGLAGTGKTTVLAALLPTLHRHCRLALCAPTGKAVSVLRSKGLPAQTIHSLFYTPYKENGKLRFHKKEPEELSREIDLIIIDEASMVNAQVHADLLSYGVPILYVGDYGQLPPVGEDPRLMERCDAVLTTVHRQALNSPIIRLAHHVRQHGAWESWPEWPAKPEGVRTLSLKSPEVFDHVSQFIVSMNSDRVALNRHFRAAYQRTATLVAGDRVICIKNDRRVGIFNGMMFTVTGVTSLHRTGILATLVADDGTIFSDLDISPSFFHTEKANIADVPFGMCAFDYAYAITAHKSQGSQFPSVTILETPAPALWSRSRWLYTAITRAESRVTLLTR